MTSTDTAIAHGEFITGNSSVRLILDDTLYMVQVRRSDNGCWDFWYSSKSLRNAKLVLAQRNAALGIA